MQAFGSTARRRRPPPGRLLSVLQHRHRRGSTPADAPTARRDDEAETDAPATIPDARPAVTRENAPAAEAKQDADDDDDSWAEFY